MLLVKEDTEVEVVTDDMMAVLMQTENIISQSQNQNMSKKIHLIRVLRSLSKVATGRLWGLRACKIFIETHFIC